MPGIREYITFHADVPDDSRRNKWGDVIVPAGRAVTQSLKCSLQASGCWCSDVVQQGDYGWAFEAEDDKCMVSCLLQPGRLEWLLIVRPHRTYSARIMTSRRSPFRDFQQAVQTYFQTDSRFWNVLWYTEREYETGDKHLALSTV